MSDLVSYRFSARISGGIYSGVCNQRISGEEKKTHSNVGTRKRRCTHILAQSKVSQLYEIIRKEHFISAAICALETKLTVLRLQIPMEDLISGFLLRIGHCAHPTGFRPPRLGPVTVMQRQDNLHEYVPDLVLVQWLI